MDEKCGVCNLVRKKYAARYGTLRDKGTVGMKFKVGEMKTWRWTGLCWTSFFSDVWDYQGNCLDN